MNRVALVCLALLACDDEPAPTATALARSVDTLGVPRMIEVTGATASAVEHVARLAPMWGVKTMPVLATIGEVRVPGGTITRIKQVLDGLPVWGGELRVLVAGDRATVTGTLRGEEMPRDSGRFIDDEAAAIRRVLEPGEVIQDALARKVWLPSGGVLVAAWVIDASTSKPLSTDGDARRTFIAGSDGRVLARESLVADAFSYRVYAEPTGEKHPLDGPLVDATPHPTGVPDGSYPAYLAAPSLITVDSLSSTGDPWLAADATTTSGNNIEAYVDVNAPNGLSDGDFHAAAQGNAFDYTYDVTAEPLSSMTQQQASITSLFYVLNWLHDFWYDAGFTEVTGNAQLVNYGRGGVEGDPLFAEAQDSALGPLRNNANMSTPDDGMSPRMQVYLWTARDTRTMVLQPSGRTPAIGGAAFGPKDFDVSAEVVIGTDGAGTNPADGCEPYTIPCAGKVVLVDRGNCTFKRKTLNAQNASAVGVIVINNTNSTTPPPLGDDVTITTTITIPAVTVTDVEGALIEQDVAAGTTTATIHRDVAHPELDGALDATLVAHEFGHYLHHRLALCGNQMCRALSEGWGDFSALMLLARAGDNLTGAFPFSVYATQGWSADPGYYGIRRAPYSVDQSINSLSYRHMADGEPLPTTHPFIENNANSEVHNAGEIWASALWDGYVALQQAGASAGISFEEVRAKMARYVVAGMLLTPVEASPMEARDAILAAMNAETPADHALMLAAFARRGFGSCAIAPPQGSTDFIGLVESTVVAGKAELVASSLADGCDEDGVLDAGETAHVMLQVGNRGHARLTDLTMTVTSAVPGLTIVSPPVALAQLAAGDTTTIDVELTLDRSITTAIEGDLALHVTAAGGCVDTIAVPFASRLNIDDRALSSATDTFDAIESTWLPWTAAWTHVRESALDGSWHGNDLAIPSDTRLTSPYLIGDATAPVVVSFSHRYSFELSSDTAFDGGVIEYSIGTDEVWDDISTIASPSYTGQLSQDPSNALSGQRAFTGANPSYPEMDVETINFGTAFAGKTFRLRFRIGTDNGTSDEGWDIDDVAFTGIVGTPFTAQVADDDGCGPAKPDDPILSGGGGCCDAGAPSNGLFALGVLAALGRRRRRT